MSDLFISYRRQDAAAQAGRLSDALAQRYGRDRVFLDIDTLAPGQDFAKQLHDVVASCKLVLVIIGPQWLRATDAHGQRRLDDPEDFIRTEVAAALRSGKPVVPILVGGAFMPSQELLPPELQALGRRQAIELRDATWHDDLRALYYALDRLLGDELRAAPMPGTGAGAPARLSFMGRILAAFDVLTGRGERDEGKPVKPVARSDEPPPVDRAITPRPEEGGRAVAAKQVFLSYAEEDRSLADEVVEMLEERGHRCWVAHRDIPAGTQSWAKPIVAAIANSKVVLILVTQYSVASKQVLREVTIADAENIPLIPVCLENVSLSEDFRYFFASAQRLQIADVPRQQTVQMIGTAVERHLASA